MSLFYNVIPNNELCYNQSRFSQSKTQASIYIEPFLRIKDNYVPDSIYYTDQSLGEFVRTAKTRDWWDQTLIILMSDHGARIGNISADEPRRFSIPMLWLGGALAVNDTVITKYGSQTDVPVTLLNQIGLPADDFKISKDLLSEDTKSFAYYTFNDGIGFLCDSSSMTYSLITKDYLFDERSGSEITRDAGLAYLQYLLDDFIDK